MNINVINQKMDRRELLIRTVVIVGIIALLIVAFTMPVFAAGQLQTGKNVGEWGLQQIWYVALAVVAFMIVKFLIKKAWVPMVIFIVLGALCLYIISSPEALKSIGQKLFNLI